MKNKPFYKSDDYLIYNFDGRISIYSKIGDTNQYNWAMNVENDEDISKLPDKIKDEVLKIKI